METFLKRLWPAALSTVLIASALAAIAVGSPADPWQPISAELAMDVPAGFGAFKDIDRNQPGVQVKVRLWANSLQHQVRFALTKDDGIVGEAADGLFEAQEAFGAGGRVFAWGLNATGAARLWTPAFDGGRTLLSMDPAVPCVSVPNPATPVGGPFTITIPAGVKPGGQTVASPTSAFVYGAQMPGGKGLRFATTGGVGLGEDPAADVRGGLTFGDAIFAYGAKGDGPRLWTPRFDTGAKQTREMKFVSCTSAPPATGTVTVVKALVPTSDSGRFNLLVDGGGSFDVGHGGTAVVTVSAGTHVVSETAGTATQLTSYTSDVYCKRQSDGLERTASGSVLTGLLVAAGDDWRCRITNIRNSATGALPALSVTPGTTPAGALIRIASTPGINPVGSLELYIGGQLAPVHVDPRGGFSAAVPLFLNPTSLWPDPPTTPVDALLFENGVPVAFGAGVVTISALPHAPGATTEVQALLDAVADSVEALGAVSAPIPGAQQQWMQGVTGALDGLLRGNDPASLAGALASTDPAARELLDALFAATGYLDGLRQFAGQLATLAGGATGTPVRLEAADPPDLALARDMQFQEVVKLLGDTVIGPTAQEWGLVVGNLIGGLGLAGQVPGAQAFNAVGAVLGVLDFALNKIYVGLLPQNITKLELSLAAPRLDPGAVTDATLKIEAANDPPAIGIQDVIGQILTLGGVPETPATVGKFTQAASYFLNLVQGLISVYAAEHPSLNLSIGLQVPALTWQATITDPLLVERRSQTPSLIEGLPNAVNWQAASPAAGEGRIFARTAFGPEVLLVSLPPSLSYTPGAFGVDNLQNSNEVAVPIGAKVTISPRPTSIESGVPKQFSALVEFAASAAVTWTATNGTVDSTGLFTNDPGAVFGSVTATSVSQPEVSDTHIFNIGPGMYSVRLLEDASFSTVRINDRGEVIAHTYPPSSGQELVLWDAVGNSHVVPGQLFGYGRALNNLGQVLLVDNAGELVIRNEDGTLITTGLTASGDLKPYHLTDNQEIIGMLGPYPDNYFGFVWKDGVVSHLPVPSGYQAISSVNGSPQQMNRLGEFIGTLFNDPSFDLTVVKWSSAFATPGAIPFDCTYGGLAVGISLCRTYVSATGLAHHFIHNYATGTQSEIGVGANNRTLTTINDAGEVAGNIEDPVTGQYATLWKNGNFIDLNSRLEPGSPAAGYRLVDAYAMNNVGQIVVLGQTPSGEIKVFLLTPIR